MTPLMILNTLAIVSKTFYKILAIGWGVLWAIGYATLQDIKDLSWIEKGGIIGVFVVITVVIYKRMDKAEKKLEQSNKDLLDEVQRSRDRVIQELEKERLKNKS